MALQEHYQVMYLLDTDKEFLEKVKKHTGNFGFNAATGDFGDMIKLGIMDPTKVTKCALQHAGSVVGLMITTEAAIADIPKNEKDNVDPMNNSINQGMGMM